MSNKLEPITREEYFLARAGGQDVETPEPMTREEHFLEDIIEAIDSVSEPTQEQVDSAVTDYFDEHGIDTLFIDSEDIQEVLEG